MKRPPPVSVNGVLDPESLMKSPPIATTMAFPAAPLVTPAPLASVRLPEAVLA